MSESKTPDESSPTYAFKVISHGNFERAKLLIEYSCQTCGHPYVRAADMCPECLKELDQLAPAMVAALADHLHPRWIHSSTHGFIDPWSREGRRLLDD